MVEEERVAPATAVVTLDSLVEKIAQVKKSAIH